MTAERYFWISACMANVRVAARPTEPEERYVKEADYLALEQQLEALRRDAERYRWLRHGDNDEVVMRDPSGKKPDDADGPSWFLLRNESLDGAIDAARQQEALAARTGKEGQTVALVPVPTTEGEGWISPQRSET